MDYIVISAEFSKCLDFNTKERYNIIDLAGENICKYLLRRADMSFKNPDRLKKDKNKVKKVTYAPKIGNKNIKSKTPKKPKV